MGIRREDGGDVSILTKGSHKKIIFACNVCKKEVTQSYQNYLRQNSGKFCRSCRNKHTANRKDVKEKQAKASKEMWKSESFRKEMGKLLSKATKKAWDKDDGTRRKKIWNKTPYKEVQKLIKSVPGHELLTSKEEYEEVGNKFKVMCPDGSIMETTITLWKRNIEGYVFYDTYAFQLEWCEEVRRNKENREILEVRCKKCDEWYVLNTLDVSNRVQALKGQSKGECNLYCSENCKNSCSIYGKKPEVLIHNDAIRAGRDPWWNEPRHMQPEWRKMVLERDDYTCQKCGKTKVSLIAHHINPVKLYPLESADVDNGITLCVDCHEKAHQIPGCSTGELANFC